MPTSRIPLIIGIGAIIYLIAAVVGDGTPGFDFSLILVMLSPLVSWACLVGLILAIRSHIKTRRQGITDHSLVAAIILNMLGILGPFCLPIFIQFTM